MKIIGSRIAAVALACAAFAAARADAPAVGELWETTAQASIPGMPVNMPAYKAKTCKKPGWTAPPQTSQDPKQNCKTTDFVQTPTKITWKMVCDSPPMNGEGEINFNGTDAYEGEFTMQSAQFNMHMALSGQKLGACDNPE
jgi:Protein of unknown function (DUF3617)